MLERQQALPFISALAYLQGMQHNPGVPTVESELMGALAKAGAISPANAGKFAKVWAGLGLEMCRPLVVLSRKHAQMFYVLLVCSICTPHISCCLSLHRVILRCLK